MLRFLLAEYRLLEEFKRLFEGCKYEHRRSNLGGFVAMHLYEDLAAIAKSQKYVVAVAAASRVLNVQNKRKGVDARRGDGTFGELVPGGDLQHDQATWSHEVRLRPSRLVWRLRFWRRP